MILHADMPCFGDYEVLLNGEVITVTTYMADVQNGVVIRRFAAEQGHGFEYRREEGTVAILYRAQKPASMKQARKFI